MISGTGDQMTEWRIISLRKTVNESRALVVVAALCIIQAFSSRSRLQGRAQRQGQRVSVIQTEDSS
jgi:hypothetical protein